MKKTQISSNNTKALFEINKQIEGSLRNHARTSLQLWLDSVVPFGQSFVALQSK